MRDTRLVLLIATCAVGGATIVSATATVAQPVRIVLGLTAVFLAPGFALGSALLPERQSSVERLLISVGLSLTVATCTAVLLAAAAIGLTRESFGVALGGFTVVTSISAMFRAPTMLTARPRDDARGRSEGQPGHGPAVEP
jgi:uncharacterized membrane protein